MDNQTKEKLKAIISEEIFRLKDSVFAGDIPLEVAKEAIKLLSTIFNRLDEEFNTTLEDLPKAPQKTLYEIVKQGE